MPRIFGSISEAIVVGVVWVTYALAAWVIVLQIL